MSCAPSLEKMLKFDYWEMHEAACILTSWPKDTGWTGVPYGITDKFERGFFYFIENIYKIQPDTATVLSMLKNSIKTGELFARRVIFNFNKVFSDSYGDNVSYIIIVWDVICWAFFKGINLSDEFQQQIGVYQLIGKAEKADHKIVKDQIIGQFYLTKNPDANISNLIELSKDKDSWFYRFGKAEKYLGKEKKGLRNHLDELYDSPGKRGRRKKESKITDRKYVHRPIPNVMKVNVPPFSQYNYSLFRTALTTGIQIIIDMIGQEKFLELTESQFFAQLTENEVMSLYFQGISNNGLDIARQICIDVLTKHYYLHQKINYIPFDERQLLPISEQIELHKDYCYGPRFPRNFRMAHPQIFNIKVTEIKLNF